ncbi:tRNA (adenine(22)-N(1))-methyltransferase TrmK [Faecalibaculum rodentium]|uniref:tRNA (adenine(22)-N(1))-methyltransferase TrmK n=1 Tax=Faecalibaculum rodentium TaxID=1702221 RepID=UPI003F6694E9
MAESVIPLLSDGLQALPEACSQIVIAGMGAETIVSILESGADRLDPDPDCCCRLTPKASVLRDWLDHNGWRICGNSLSRIGPVLSGDGRLSC